MSLIIYALDLEKRDALAAPSLVIITMNPVQAGAQAIALKDGLIQQVGNNAQIQTLVGEATGIF